MCFNVFDLLCQTFVMIVSLTVLWLSLSFGTNLAQIKASTDDSLKLKISKAKTEYNNWDIQNTDTIWTCVDNSPMCADKAFSCTKRCVVEQASDVCVVV